MHNKRMNRKVDELIQKSFDFWKDLLVEYKMGRIPFTIYDNRFTKSYSNQITRVKLIEDPTMVTLFEVSGVYIDKDICDDDRVIAEISAGIFMSYERLYQFIIECELDFEKAFESMKFCLRHELGHILVVLNNDIGITLREWKDGCIREKEEEKSLPKLRKNASKDNCLKWYLQYHSLPREKRANDMVGITEEDIVNDISRIIRGLS